MQLRVLANPFVALPLWAANLVLWHVPFFYEAAVENPFYLMAPEWARLPLVFIATAALGLSLVAGGLLGLDGHRLRPRPDPPGGPARRRRGGFQARPGGGAGLVDPPRHRDAGPGGVRASRPRPTIAMTKQSVSVIPVPGLPEIREGDDLTVVTVVYAGVRTQAA